MKKVIFLIAFIALSFMQVLDAQVTCEGVNVSAYPKRVQSGSYDYYGVQVALTQAYSQDITVVGTITEEGGQNVVNMFTLTVTAENLMARTSETFYSVPHGRSVVVTVESIDPCLPPVFIEAIIGTYSTLDNTYTIGLNRQDQDLIDGLTNQFSVQNPTIDSLMIYDDSPTLIDSASYLVFYVTATNAKFAFGLHLKKEYGNDQIVYRLNNSSYSVSRAWSCKKNSSCINCVPHRNWFAGPVKGCDCGGSNETNDCIFETSGSGFPWAPVLGLIGVIITIIVKS